MSSAWAGAEAVKPTFYLNDPWLMLGWVCLRSEIWKDLPADVRRYAMGFLSRESIHHGRVHHCQKPHPRTYLSSLLSHFSPSILTLSFSLFLWF